MAVIAMHGIHAMARLATLAFERFDQAELRLCCYLNRANDVLGFRALFRGVSWLGNGWVWYALIAAMPALYGRDGLHLAAQMVVTGAAGVLIYWAIKGRTVRQRPYVTHTMISCGSAPLDKYSFPSGHTLHAVCFTLLVIDQFPEWSAVLGALAVAIALSRVTLGLHYPTDVAAGALLGAALATASIGLKTALLA